MPLASAKLRSAEHATATPTHEHSRLARRSSVCDRDTLRCPEALLERTPAITPKACLAKRAAAMVCTRSRSGAERSPRWNRLHRTVLSTPENSLPSRRKLPQGLRPKAAPAPASMVWLLSGVALPPASPCTPHPLCPLFAVTDSLREPDAGFAGLFPLMQFPPCDISGIVRAVRFASRDTGHQWRRWLGELLERS